MHQLLRELDGLRRRVDELEQAQAPKGPERFPFRGVISGATAADHTIDQVYPDGSGGWETRSYGRSISNAKDVDGRENLATGTYVWVYPSLNGWVFATDRLVAVNADDVAPGTIEEKLANKDDWLGFNTITHPTASLGKQREVEHKDPQAADALRVITLTAGTNIVISGGSSDTIAVDGKGHNPGGENITIAADLTGYVEDSDLDPYPTDGDGIWIEVDATPTINHIGPSTADAGMAIEIVAGTDLSGGGTIAVDAKGHIVAGGTITLNLDLSFQDDNTWIETTYALGVVTTNHIGPSAADAGMAVEIAAGDGLAGGGTIAVDAKGHITAGTTITLSLDISFEDDDTWIEVTDNLGVVTVNHIGPSVANAGMALEFEAGSYLTGGGTVSVDEKGHVVGGESITFNVSTTTQEVVTDVRTTATELQKYTKTVRIIEVVTDHGWSKIDDLTECPT